MKKYKFIKTLSGMVLYVEDRKAIKYGEWEYFFRKATEVEANEYLMLMIENNIRKKVVNEIKKDHPEFMI